MMRALASSGFAKVSSALLAVVDGTVYGLTDRMMKNGGVTGWDIPSRGFGRLELEGMANTLEVSPWQLAVMLFERGVPGRLVAQLAAVTRMSRSDTGRCEVSGCVHNMHICLRSNGQ